MIVFGKNLEASACCCCCCKSSNRSRSSIADGVIRSKRAFCRKLSGWLLVNSTEAAGVEGYVAVFATAARTAEGATFGAAATCNVSLLFAFVAGCFPSCSLSAESLDDSACFPSFFWLDFPFSSLGALVGVLSVVFVPSFLYLYLRRSILFSIASGPMSRKSCLT